MANAVMGEYVMHALDKKITDFIKHADEKACNHCKAMRDKKFSIKDRKAGINFPPFHSWCRYSFIIAVDDWDKWIDDYAEKYGKEPGNSVKSVVNSGESGIINSGTISGALKPDSMQAQKHADRYYESVRHMKTDVKKLLVTQVLQKMIFQK